MKIGFAGLLLFALLHVNNLFGKVTYMSDCYFIKSKLKIEAVDFRKTALIFDVWYYSLANGRNKLLQLRKGKDNRWHGMIYSFYYYNRSQCDFKNASAEILFFRDDWDQQWNKIENKLLMDIGDQQTVNSQLKQLQSDKELLLISDGNSVEYNLYKAKFVKEITYDSAEEYLDFFKKKGLKSVSYEHVLAIMDLLQTEWSFKFSNDKGIDLNEKGKDSLKMK